MTTTGHDIRSQFIAFFEQLDHTHVPSSSLLPGDDPTLLFANAGMNQFKPLFLGTETRDYTRAANSQKCIRAGGKHNDLDDVGRDCYHHTFFEMLGNWSFGDYFKAEAIDWAWTLLTETWGLDPDRLHATYFEGDDSEGLAPDTEARELWTKYLPADRIHPGNKKDNFWEMGETGPCGPCSEIHYDATDDKTGGPLVNQDNPRVIEIWNLVFIQFNRGADGSLDTLPAKHVDTGMGLERIAAVMQGKKSNYATDLFVPILQTIEEISGKQYGQGTDGDRYDATDEENLIDVAMRVIADHVRSLTFALADGIRPGNEGRGYVLRSILRRAAGFGRQHLQIDGAFLDRLVPVVVEAFGEDYPELRDRQDAVIQIIREEEESFGETLDRGLELFQGYVNRALMGDGLASEGQGKNTPSQQEIIAALESKDNKTFVRKYYDTPPVIDGRDAFELHATYGFPIALTKLMAEKAGLGVDEAGFEAEMEQHRQTSRAGADDKFNIEQVVGLPATDDAPKYADKIGDVTVLGWVKEGRFIDDGVLGEHESAALVLDKTCFYAEAGGQVGDAGTLLSIDESGIAFEVSDTQRAGACVLHMGELLAGELRPGQHLRAEVDPSRRDTKRNHTATHLLNWALREVLGDSIDQAGSVVDPERLRFDFTHSQAVTAEQLRQVEQLVNQRVLADEPVTDEEMALAEAKKLPGVRAVFGEKYPDPVRVITIGRADAKPSIEFCGGTHLERTGQIGLFKIVSEESVAKGIRRITAVTGSGALGWAFQADDALRDATGLLKCSPEDIADRIASLQKEIKKLRKKPAAGAGSAELADATELNTPAGKVFVARSSSPDAAVMRNLCDQQRQKGSAAILLAAADADEGKVLLTAMVAEELVKSAGFKAGDWIKPVAAAVGGGGGGKPTLAQAGGKQPENLPAALTAAVDFAREKLT
jgi:alanyl-tRNA synthetase